MQFIQRLPETRTRLPRSEFAENGRSMRRSGRVLQSRNEYRRPLEYGALGLVSGEFNFRLDFPLTFPMDSTSLNMVRCSCA